MLDSQTEVEILNFKVGLALSDMMLFSGQAALKALPVIAES